MTTEILGLDEILASQSQKEVAHNTALRQIEGRLVRALSKALAVPPTSPAEGSSYIVAASPTGAWSGQAGKITHFFGGAWKFWQPIEGVRLWVNDEDKVYAFDGSEWVVSGGDPTAAASSAVTAHEAASNPHPQYLTQSEADARYAGSGDGSATMAAHVAASDPHPQYMTQAESDARYLQSVPAQPYDLVCFNPGVATSSAKVARAAFTRSVTFPSGLAGSVANAAVAATASNVFDIQKNGTSVGSVTFAAGATTGTFAAASAISLASGDRLSIVAPATVDATLADVSITLAGTR